MRTFGKDELEQFLVAVDQALTHPVDVIVIGGTAAALHYGVTRRTHDIDTWTAVQEDLAVAVEKARASTGLDVPVAHSGVADAPHDFESRLERILPHLERLRLFVPEKHDLVLMKAIRGYEHDLEAALQMHAHSPLDLETLVGRFQDEMTPIGDPVRIRGNFLHLVDSLFPEAADDVARRLEQGRT